MPFNIISLDLGNNNCKFSYFDENRIINIETDTSRYLTSILCYNENDEKILCGEPALSMIGIKNKSIIYNMKYLLSMKYSNLDKELIDFFPFEIICKNDYCYYNFKYNNNNVVKSPCDVIYELLDFARNRYLNSISNDVILTVPSFYSEYDKRIYKECVNKSGLNVVLLLEEAIAVLYSYINEKIKLGKKVIVFDLGSSKLEVSLIIFGKETIKLVSSECDRSINGDNMTYKLLKHFIKVIRNEAGYDIINDKRKLYRLRKELEINKKNLSDYSSIDMDVSLPDDDITITLTTDLFNKLNNKLFEKSIKLIEKTIINSNIKEDSISDIILSGCGCHITEIVNMISERFPKMKIHQEINVEEVVCKGGAIYGHLMKTGKNPYKIIRDYDNLKESILKSHKLLDNELEIPHGSDESLNFDIKSLNPDKDMAVGVDIGGYYMVLSFHKNNISKIIDNSVFSKRSKTIIEYRDKIRGIGSNTSLLPRKNSTLIRYPKPLLGLNINNSDYELSYIHPDLLKKSNDKIEFIVKNGENEKIINIYHLILQIIHFIKSAIKNEKLTDEIIKNMPFIFSV